MTDQQLGTADINLRPEWAAKYARQYLVIGAIWFGALVLLVGGILLYLAVIKHELPVGTALASTAGFVVVMFVLSAWMFGKHNQCWRGQVASQRVREIRSRQRDSDGGVVVTTRRVYEASVRMPQGRMRKVELSEPAYRLLQEGDELVKYKGMPSATNVLKPDTAQRICCSCGQVAAVGDARCPRCRWVFPPS
jgi:hypothetical protein